MFFEFSFQFFFSYSIAMEPKTAALGWWASCILCGACQTNTLISMHDHDTELSIIWFVCVLGIMIESESSIKWDFFSRCYFPDVVGIKSCMYNKMCTCVPTEGCNTAFKQTYEYIRYGREKQWKWVRALHNNISIVCIDTTRNQTHINMLPGSIELFSVFLSHYSYIYSVASISVNEMRYSRNCENFHLRCNSELQDDDIVMSCDFVDFPFVQFF